MIRRIVFLLLLVTAGACQQKIIPEISLIEEAKINSVIEVPKDSANMVYLGIRYPEEVFTFYRSRRYTTFWFDHNKISERADSLIAIIRSIRRYGLLPQDYHGSEIGKMASIPDDEIKFARQDIILTDAFLSIANDLKHGRAQNLISAELDNTSGNFLNDTLEAWDIEPFFNAQEPKYNQYELLKHALNRILDSVDTSDQNRLMQGVTIDSIEIHRKVQCIEINLERWRRENGSLENVYAWVNIPSFMFYFVENHNVLLESAVVVGAPPTPTPVFSSMLECFTIFPYWFMPRKIAVREYLPVIKRDTSFLSRNNFDVLDKYGKILNQKTIDWKKYSENNFPFVLRQREGKENALGIIKFVFDNPYSVFVHDTNSKKLFRQKVRAYSHGCIRLEKAVEFAHHLTGNRSGISSRTLTKYLGMQKRMTVSLTEPIPIYIRYFTCEVRGGDLRFFHDIYKKDLVLVNTLYRRNALSRLQN